MCWLVELRSTRISQRSSLPHQWGQLPAGPATPRSETSGARFNNSVRIHSICWCSENVRVSCLFQPGKRWCRLWGCFLPDVLLQTRTLLREWAPGSRQQWVCWTWLRTPQPQCPLPDNKAAKAPFSSRHPCLSRTNRPRKYLTRRRKLGQASIQKIKQTTKVCQKFGWFCANKFEQSLEECFEKVKVANLSHKLSDNSRPGTVLVQNSPLLVVWFNDTIPVWLLSVSLGNRTNVSEKGQEHKPEIDMFRKNLKKIKRQPRIGERVIRSRYLVLPRFVRLQCENITLKNRLWLCLNLLCKWWDLTVQTKHYPNESSAKQIRRKKSCWRVESDQMKRAFSNCSANARWNTYWNRGNYESFDVGESLPTSSFFRFLHSWALNSTQKGFLWNNSQQVSQTKATHGCGVILSKHSKLSWGGTCTRALQDEMKPHAAVCWWMFLAEWRTAAVCHSIQITNNGKRMSL